MNSSINQISELNKVLEDLELTELQINCYFAILKSSGIKISSLAKQIAVNRPNTYTLVEKLKELDLVYEENLVNGKVIYAKPLKSIISALEAKKLKFEDNIALASSLAPIFESLQSSSNSFLPKIRTFDTKYSLDTIADDILSSSKNQEILLFSNQITEKLFFSKKMHEEFVGKRVKNNSPIRVLAVKNREGENLQREDHKYLRTTKLLPESMNFKSEIYLYNNKIAMIDIKESVIGIIIESEELYNFHKQSFELIWNNI